jgi:hypothetical protein
MLSKITRIKSGSLRLRYGVVPLAVPLAFVGPVAAATTAPGNSPTGHAVTYVNLAKATSRSDNWTDYSVKFRLHQSSTSVINADDTALARATRCQNCGAIAIAFQVIFAPAHRLNAVNENATAEATSAYCDNCSTLAEAYQIVDVSNTEQRLTRRQLAALRQVQRQLAALPHAGLSTDQIQSEVAGLANQVVAILENGTVAAPSSEVPSVSPAVTNSADLTPLTELGQPAESSQPTAITQPSVQLFVQVQSS